jgi:hypothetical protein
VTLARAVNLLHANKDDYIAVLFYASWCPFSQECKPNFETLAYLFPAIRHFAFEESAIRPRFVLYSANKNYFLLQHIYFWWNANLMLELQHNFEIRHPWFPNTLSLELDHESTISWTKDC